MMRLLILITLSALIFLQTALTPIQGFAEVLTSKPQPSEFLPSTQAALPATLPKNAITWPLLPNESIANLATLFYPKNAAMQARFIAHTLVLNTEQFNNQKFSKLALTAYAKAQQVTLIIIPELESLSNETTQNSRVKRIDLPRNVRAPWKNPLQLSYSLKDAAQFIVSPKLVAAYDDLIKRNEFLKVELQKLNHKLSELQSLVVTLKTEATAILTMSGSQKPVVKIKQSNIATPILTNSVGKPEENSSVNYLLFGTLAFLAFIIFIIAFKAYKRNQLKYLNLTAEGLFKPLETGQFKTVADIATQQGNEQKGLDFSFTQNGSVDNVAQRINGQVIVDEVVSPAHLNEVEQILEQARIFVNIGRTDEAIELMKAQIKARPKASLRHWLYLLDIFRDHDQKEEFLGFANQLHESFNVIAPLWDNEPLAMTVAKSLEQFPHIVDTLSSLWNKENGYLETKAYLLELLIDNREKERMGFSMQVFQEIVLLSEILEIREKLATNSD